MLSGKYLINSQWMIAAAAEACKWPVSLNQLNYKDAIVTELLFCEFLTTVYSYA